MPKVLVVDRDIMSFQGVLALKETYIYLDEQNLYGVFLEVNENSNDFNYMLQSTGENFLTDKRYYGHLKDDYFYTVVNCHGDDRGKYSVFYGGELANSNKKTFNLLRKSPASKRSGLRVSSLTNDFYRWMLIKEIEPCPNGIGMLNIYDRQDMRSVRILVPVKQLK